MLDENRVDQILSEITETHVRKRNGGFNARCPVCGDSAKKKRLRRLHIDWYQKYEDWVVTCYNGGCPFRSGNLYSLYAEVQGIDYRDAKRYINQDTYNTEQIKQRLSSRSNSVKPDIVDDGEQVLDLDMDDILPFNSKSEDRVHRRYVVALQQFMIKRCIRKPCFVAYKGRYKGRFIIPVYLHGKMVYFQGRSILDSLEPKYLNPVVDKSSIIMNSDKFDKSKSICVTEGIIDAWMVEDDQGTSVLGAYFDDDLVGKLFKYTDKDIILCFDNPLIDKAGKDELLKHIEESKFKDKVKYFLPDRKDFKDLNELRGIHQNSIYDYIINNSFTSLNVKVKLSLLYK